MVRLPSITALFLAALIALTSLGTGHAQGAAHIAGQIVICTGQGVVTISVDADGVPVERVVPCPDCILTLFAEGPEPSDAAWRTGPACAQLAITATRGGPLLRDGRPPARAPPRAA